MSLIDDLVRRGRETAAEELRSRTKRGVEGLLGALGSVLHLVTAAAATYLTFRLSKFLLSFVELDSFIRWGVAGVAAFMGGQLFLNNKVGHFAGLSVYMVSFFVLPVLGALLTYDYLPLSSGMEGYRFWFAAGGGALGFIIAAGVGAFAVKWRDARAASIAARGAVRKP